jgi:biopolymer transport protein ExbD
MKLARPARRARPEPVVALIDVTFFLLVFFLLVARMDATAPFAVQPPQAQGGADMPGGGITVSVAADGALALDGVGLDAAALLARVAARLQDSPQALVRLNADRGAALRHVLPLLHRIEGLGPVRVVLAVTPDGPP